MGYLIFRLFYYVYETYTNFVLGFCIYFYAFVFGAIYFISFIAYNSEIAKKINKNYNVLVFHDIRYQIKI
jgi:hypothetical protein